MLIATKSSRINISEEEKTKSIAKIFSKNIKVSNVLFFKGELGVGKTTFIKYLINKLNELISVFPELVKKMPNKKKLRIDLRYPTGFAVQ